MLLCTKLNAGATTHALRRTSIGPFLVEQALPLASFTSFDVVKQQLIPIEAFTRQITSHT